MLNPKQMHGFSAPSDLKSVVAVAALAAVAAFAARVASALEAHPLE